jgi:hypothetical protein
MDAMKRILIRTGCRRVFFYVAFAVEVALVVPRVFAVVDQQNVPASATGWSNIGGGNFIDWAQTAGLTWINWSWRFRLRTLLIATTLVSVVLGLVVLASR